MTSDFPDERRPPPADDLLHTKASEVNSAPVSQSNTDLREQADHIRDFYLSATPKIISWLMQNTPATLDQAAESTHEAMIDIARSWETVHTNRLAWTITNAKRRYLRRKYSATGDSFDDLPPDSPLLIAKGQDVARQIEAKFELAAVMKRVSQLPQRQRAILNLFLAGFSHREIAEIESCSEESSRWNLHAARRKLNTELDDGSDQ